MINFSLRKQTDIASDLVRKYPRLATLIRVNGDFGLKVLATKVSAFKSGSYHQGWQDIIYNRKFWLYIYTSTLILASYLIIHGLCLIVYYYNF